MKDNSAEIIIQVDDRVLDQYNNVAKNLIVLFNKEENINSKEKYHENSLYYLDKIIVQIEKMLEEDPSNIKNLSDLGKIYQTKIKLSQALLKFYDLKSKLDEEKIQLIYDSLSISYESSIKNFKKLLEILEITEEKSIKQVTCMHLIQLYFELHELTFSENHQAYEGEERRWMNYLLTIREYCNEFIKFDDKNIEIFEMKARVLKILQNKKSIGLFLYDNLNSSGNAYDLDTIRTKCKKYENNSILLDKIINFLDNLLNSSNIIQEEKECYRRIIGLDPNNTAARKNLADISLRLCKNSEPSLVKANNVNFQALTIAVTEHARKLVRTNVITINTLRQVQTQSQSLTNQNNKRPAPGEWTANIEESRNVRQNSRE